MAAPIVSFTIRRPTPASRAASSGAESDSSSFKVPSLPRHFANTGSPLVRSTNASPKPNSRAYHNPDSSDEEDHSQDELVTGFDQFGVQRLHEKPKQEKQGPLVIPALQNRDWRELARKRLQVSKRAKVETDVDPVGVQLKHEDVKGEESEDQKAIRALLASADDALDDKLPIDVIPIPITETDAYRQDVVDLPDEATLDDYARVPVSQFGAALLRGMGWTEGTAASRTKKGLVEPYLPEARPSLLGIGAKEREIVDDGSKRRKGNQKPERRYIPVIKKERESPGTDSARDGDRERSLSGTSSRRRSRSPRRPDSRRASPPAPRRNSRSPTRQDRDREVSERRSKKDSRRDYEGRNRDGQKDSRKSYVGNLELDGRERRKNQSPITNGDSNGRRRLD